MLVLLSAFGVTHEHEPVARQAWALATEAATETDCNATRRQPSDRRCVIARFPKTGGTMVKHLIEGQHHVMSLREFGQLRLAEFSADAYIIGQTRLGQTQTYTLPHPAPTSTLLRLLLLTLTLTLTLPFPLPHLTRTPTLSLTPKTSSPNPNPGTPSTGTQAFGPI